VRKLGKSLSKIAGSSRERAASTRAILSDDGEARYKTENQELEDKHDNEQNQGTFPVGGPDIRGRTELGQSFWNAKNMISYLSSGVAQNGEKRDPRLCPWKHYSLMDERDKQAIAYYLKKL
jgi:hypothetical protein